MRNHRGSNPPQPSYMVAQYTAQYGDTLRGIAASYGVDPRQVAAASGLGNWHHEAPLPPGTLVLFPAFPMPARVIVASAKTGDPRGEQVDPRSPLADPGAVTVRAQALPFPLPTNL